MFDSGSSMMQHGKILDSLFQNNYTTGIVLFVLDNPVHPADFESKKSLADYLLNNLCLTKTNTAFAEQYHTLTHDLSGLTLGTVLQQQTKYVQQVTEYLIDKGQYLLFSGGSSPGSDEGMLRGEFFLIRDEESRITGCFVMQSDITEQKKQEIITEVIYNISKAAFELDDFHTFYVTIQKEINRLVDADNMFVAFYDQPTDQLNIQYVTGESDAFNWLPAEGTISKLVITENCSLLLNHELLTNLDERGKIRRIGKSSKTWLGVPLRHGNDPFGVLVIQNYERTDALNEEDQALLEFISIQLVSAIRRMQDSEQIEVLRNSIMQSPVSVVITNREGEIDYVNPKFEEVTGYSFSEVIGQNPRFLKSGKHSDILYKSLWDTILSGQSWRGEMQNRKKDGSLYWEQVSISPVQNVFKQITHFVAIKEDISDRKRMEQELFDAKDKAEESDRLKTAFLANMSHEIRTPMNGILGFAELLREGGLSEKEVHTYLNIIHSNGNQLLGIINDIITVSNLEVKQLRIHPSNFDLHGLIKNIRFTMEMERKYLSKEHIELRFPEKSACQIWMRTDHGKLQQVLINLLKNALKFTDQGCVELGVKEIDHQVLQFSIQDTGIGISPNMQEIIFDRFRQVDDSNTRSFGGTGLGLAISRGLVELLGGTIRVSSEERKGSEFTFQIPYQRPEK